MDNPTPMLAHRQEHDAEPSQLGDAALLARIGQRDESALGLLYARHSAVLFSLACRMLSDPLEAEEVLQDVFVRTWKHAPSYDPTRSSVFTWLVMIARRQCLDRLRARRSNPLRGFATPSLDDLPPCSDGRQEEERSYSEIGEMVLQKLALLSEEQRRCIEMAYFEGYTQNEIAMHLDEPLGTIKARIRRGLLKLKRVFPFPHD